MFTSNWEKISLEFVQPSGTSRGVLTHKNSWLISIYKTDNSSVKGVGEASIIEGLSPDWSENYEAKIDEVCKNINDYLEPENFEKLRDFPSIYFALETALLDLKNGGKQILFPSDFTEKKKTIPINGLIWMGGKDFMLKQIREKLAEGFSCLKLKIGAIDFNTEVEILQFIRKEYSTKDLEIRVDANGAFHTNDALHKLNILSELKIHSIEQPIAVKQWEEMRELCAKSAIPIALDEELIGIHSINEKQNLLEIIQPQYIILKPSLIGGFKGTDEWIQKAEENNILWWITSALEANVGLNAIAQYTFIKNNPLPQGLGTGKLFKNNTPSNLQILNGNLIF